MSPRRDQKAVGRIRHRHADRGRAAGAVCRRPGRSGTVRRPGARTVPARSVARPGGARGVAERVGYPGESVWLLAMAAPSRGRRVGDGVRRCIAVIAVWQETRIAPMKPAPMIVAELKNEPPATAPLRRDPFVNRSVRIRKAQSPQVPAPCASTGTRPGMEALAVRKDQVDATPAPAAMPTFMARKAEAEAAVSAQSVGVTSGAIQGTSSLDARALFYGNQLTPGANAFVPAGGAGVGGGGGGAARPPFVRRPPWRILRLDRQGRRGSCREYRGQRVAPRRARQHLTRRCEADLTTVWIPARPCA